MTYRDDNDTLRAEVARLTRELAAARPRWMLREGWWLYALPHVASVIVWTAFIAGQGWTPFNTGGALACVSGWAVWALVFVRRVPAGGAS